MDLELCRPTLAFHAAYSGIFSFARHTIGGIVNPIQSGQLYQDMTHFDSVNLKRVVVEDVAYQNYYILNREERTDLDNVLDDDDDILSYHLQLGLLVVADYSKEDVFVDQYVSLTLDSSINTTTYIELITQLNQKFIDMTPALEQWGVVSYLTSQVDSESGLLRVSLTLPSGISIYTREKELFDLFDFETEMEEYIPMPDTIGLSANFEHRLHGFSNGYGNAKTIIGSATLQDTVFIGSLFDNEINPFMRGKKKFHFYMTYDKINIASSTAVNKDSWTGFLSTDNFPILPHPSFPLTLARSLENLLYDAIEKCLGCGVTADALKEKKLFNIGIDINGYLTCLKSFSVEGGSMGARRGKTHLISDQGLQFKVFMNSHLALLLGLSTNQNFVQFGTIMVGKDEIFRSVISLTNVEEIVDPKPWYLVGHFNGILHKTALVGRNTSFPILGWVGQGGRFVSIQRQKIDFSQNPEAPISFSVIDANGKNLKIPRRFQILIEIAS